MSIIDGKTNSILNELPVGNNPKTIAVNPITSELYISNSDDNTVSELGTYVKNRIQARQMLSFRRHAVSIELWISGMMQTEGVTKLVLSAKGEGGMRVVSKPKKQAA
jgi:hypothetical protein